MANKFKKKENPSTTAAKNKSEVVKLNIAGKEWGRNKTVKVLTVFMLSANQRIL